eukprot:CAMPEP_0184503424 /NCGR_PEP_ID=MMETSP0113_2-20130426/51884_1 /TAXON_ID=91329 /ORGANISM="Norrisiella sphaerica, Strain BC52" /LENGTH=118 /DNA_ID=CAMNT_0026892919 /DNA_START=851 /DNA_END=1207 /DNA_ORIENTATION=+
MATMAGAMQMDHINVNRTALAMPTGPGVVKMEANSTYIKPEIPVSAATEEAIDDDSEQARSKWDSSQQEKFFGVGPAVPQIQQLMGVGTADYMANLGAENTVTDSVTLFDKVEDDITM